MTVVYNNLNFSIVTNNDNVVQIDINKMSDGLPASVGSAKWQMFFPGTTEPAVTKNNVDITLVNRTVAGVLYPNSAIKFTIAHTDTADFDNGKYPHEATIITTDGRIHTVTDQGDCCLPNGVVCVRKELTGAPT